MRGHGRWQKTKQFLVYDSFISWGGLWPKWTCERAPKGGFAQSLTEMPLREIPTRSNPGPGGEQSRGGWHGSIGAGFISGAT